MEGTIPVNVVVMFVIFYFFGFAVDAMCVNLQEFTVHNRFFLVLINITELPHAQDNAGQLKFFENLNPVFL